MARHNLGTVIGFEVRRTITKRRFWFTTLLVPVVMAIVAALVILSNTATSTSVDEQRSAKLAFEYTDASGLVDPGLAARVGGKVAEDPAAALAAVRDGTLDAFFAYPKDPATEHVQVSGVDAGIFANGKYGAIATALLQQSAEQRIGSPQLAALARGDVQIDSTAYKDGAVAPGFNGLLPPLMFLVVFYVVIIFLGNQMLSSTLEEKENRVMEMILTTVNPATLIIGKIVSLFVIGVVQIAVLLAPLVIGGLVFRDALQIPEIDLSSMVFDPQKMIVGALLLLGGFTLFTGTLVAIGAVMPTAKDAGAFFAATLAGLFVPFYVVSLVVSDPQAPIVQIFTYFPYSAPVTALLRNAFGSLSIGEAIVVIVELLAVGGIVLRLAVQLFRYGSIEYSRKVPVREVLARRGR